MFGAGRVRGERIGFGLYQSSSPQSTYDMTTDYNKTDGLSSTTRKPTYTIH